MVVTLPFFQENSIITEDFEYKKFNLFSLKSKSQSSFSPMAISSRSGLNHLLFLHEVTDYDAIGREYYHTYELEHGKWSLPQKVFIGVSTIFNVTITKTGFIVYYYNEGIEKRGPCYREFDEQSKKWFDETQIFGKSQIIDFLGLSADESKQFSFWIHSFQSVENGSYLIIWSFRFHHSSDFTHESEELYITSIVDGDGTIDSHSLPKLNEGYHSLQQLYFIPKGNRSFLYSSNFNARIVYSNGTWSEWQTTGFTETLSSCWDKSIITDRYLLCHGANRSHVDWPEIWGMVDLTTENLSIENVSLPNWNKNEYRLDLDLKGEYVIETALISKHSVELWEYDYLIKKWTQLAFLMHEYKSPYSEEPFNIDLFRDEDSWCVFWDEGINESNSPMLHEIFTVSYNNVTKKWSPIIQVTDTTQISDDYNSGIPGFTFFQVFIGIFFCFLLIKRKSKRTCYQ
jgi:hypothetical protein